MSSIGGYRQNLWLVVLILAAAVLVSSLDFEIAADRAAESVASLTLSYREGIARRFEGPVIEGMTMLDALNSASIAGGFDVKYEVEANGDINLAAINGQVADNLKKWHLYLNDWKIDTKNTGRVLIKKHDSIEARFE